MAFPLNSVLKKITYLLIFATSFCFVTTSIANNKPLVYLTNLTKENGLSNNYINHITKDNQGFIWIATSDGLCRYETHDRIKIYRAGEDSISTIHSSNIWTIKADSKDNLWIGTRHGGLTRYHQPTDSWTTFKHDPNDATTISNNEILSILEDHQGRIWVGTENGLNLFQPETETFLSFTVQRSNPNALQGKAVLSIFEDTHHRIWIGTWGGGLHLLLTNPKKDIRTSTFRNFKPFEDEGTHNIWRILEYRPNQLFIGAHGGGLITMQLPDDASASKDSQNWQPNYKRYQHQPTNPLSIAQDDIKDLVLDNTGLLWIATGSGINFIPASRFFLSPRTDATPIEFSVFTKQKQNQNSLVNNTVNDIFLDEQGMLWFGTIGGVSMLNPFVNQFEQYELPDFIRDDLYRNTTFIEENGEAWRISSKHGLSKYHFPKQTTINIPQKNEALNKRMNTIFASADDRFFLGSDKGIAIFNKKDLTTQFHPFPSTLASINNIYFRFIYKDKVLHKIWAATENGLIVLDEKTGEYQLFTNDPNDSNSISENSVNHVYEDDIGNLWISTYTGMNRISLATFEEHPIFDIFHTGAANPVNQIPLNKVITIEGIGDILYIGTTNGLLAYDRQQKKFTNFSQSKNKFWIQSLVATKEGNLWGAAIGNIFYFNTQTQTFNVFEKEDGLVDTDFKLNGGFKDRNGNIYFANSKGITVIPTGTITTNEIAPKLAITDIKVLDSKEEQLHVGIFLEELQINDDAYYISLQFAALNYNRPEKNQYAFRLKGFEERWNYTNKTEAIYTNLDPGSYVFQLKAANNDGIWNTTPLELTITKHPAFWQTLWFKAVSLLGLILFFFVGIKWYNKTLSAQNRLLENYNQTLNLEIKERQKTQANLENKEAFARLLMNNIPQFICWVNEKHELQGVNKHMLNAFNVKEESEVIGQHIHHFTTRVNKKDTTIQNIRKVFHSKKPILNHIQYFEIETKNNRLPFWIRQNFIPLKDANKQIISVLVTNMNITKERNDKVQLKTYNQQLIRSNKELEQFAYIASHDLRSPLTTIISFINILQKRAAEKLSSKEMEMMNFIHKGAQNMEQLVNAILEFSKINNGDLELSSFSPSKLLEVIQYEMHATLQDKNAMLCLDEMPTIIVADKIKIKQLLQNLINNGIKFSRKGVAPLIKISCKENNTHWEFKITDNGIGIEKEYNDKIFKLFQRLHSASAYEGTGIGLSLCKKIVELHEGKIWVESEFGKGSTFLFTITKNNPNLSDNGVTKKPLLNETYIGQDSKHF